MSDEAKHEVDVQLADFFRLVAENNVCTDAQKQTLLDAADVFEATGSSEFDRDSVYFVTMRDVLSEMRAQNGLEAL